jgi:hypothetical protein
MEKITNKQLEELKTVIPYHYKVQSLKGFKAVCVAYIDARDVMDKLDSVVGPLGWSEHYERDCTTGDLTCYLTIAGVTKGDTGTRPSIEPNKSEYSDSFKRAAVKWGVGRFLYDLSLLKLPKQKYKGGKEYPATLSGEILFDNLALTEYINKQYGKDLAKGVNNKPTAPAKTTTPHPAKPASLTLPPATIKALSNANNLEALKAIWNKLIPAQQKNQAIKNVFSAAKKPFLTPKK